MTNVDIFKMSIMYNSQKEQLRFQVVFNFWKIYKENIKFATKCGLKLLQYGLIAQS